jgi:hypothetical protein
MATFLDGSPVSSPANPFNDVAGIDPADILPSFDEKAVESMAMANLDAYGSSPVTSDAAAGRPLNPPTVGGDDANP